MPLDNKFKMVLEYLETPDSNHYAGDKQITYLTFDPSDTIEVKRRMVNWLSLAKGFEYNCEVISIASLVNNFFRNNPYRDTWPIPTVSEPKTKIISFFKKGLGSMIIENNVIENAILDAQEKLKSKPKPLLIISDLEAIHTFTRFGPIEQKIYIDIEIPLIILYPGTLSGSSLEFFGFYPPDGNYRSKHF
jgi:hypothetical protein